AGPLLNEQCLWGLACAFSSRSLLLLFLMRKSDMAVDLATTTRYLTNLRKHFADLVQEYKDEDMPFAAASAQRDVEEIDKLLDDIRCRILNKRTVNELSKQMDDSSTRMVPRIRAN